MAPPTSPGRVALAVTCLVVTTGFLAQGVPTLPLGAPNARLNAEFTRVSAVRELDDGRVLIVDEADKRVAVGDWKTGTVRQIGRVGSGPGEYQLPQRLLALSADSTLLTDVMAGRWLLFAGDSIVETIPASAPPIAAGARSPLGADARGWVAATRAMGMPASGATSVLPSRRDSMYLVRVNRRTGASDTVAIIAARPARISVTGPAERPTGVQIVMNPLSAGDHAVVFADGAIAVVRVDPYRVDWIGPDGRMVRGAALPLERHPVTDREKRAILQRQASELGREPRDPESVADWPAILPPFLGGVMPGGDGRVWVRRTAHAGDSRTHYDVVGRNGALAARVILGESEHVAGVSRTAAYTVETDADGIQRLRRHALPAIRSN